MLYFGWTCSIFQIWNITIVPFIWFVNFTDLMFLISRSVDIFVLPHLGAVSILFAAPAAEPHRLSTDGLHRIYSRHIFTKNRLTLYQRNANNEALQNDM